MSASSTQDNFQSYRDALAHDHAEWDKGVAFYGKSRHYLPTPVIPKMQRPHCVCCGKGYGSRRIEWVTLRAAVPEPEPRYQGNGYVISGVIQPGYIERDGSKVAGVSITLKTWDGESLWLTASRPFCSGPCALAFARSAHKAGFRVEGGAP